MEFKNVESGGRMDTKEMANFINESTTNFKKQLKGKLNKEYLLQQVMLNKQTLITCLIIMFMLGIFLKFNFISWLFGLIIVPIITKAIYNNKTLIFFQLIFSMTMLSGTLYLGMNGIFKLLPDIFAFIILIKLFVKLFKNEIKIKNIYIVTIFIIFLINIISFMINRYSLLSFIAGLRNYYIFYISFLGYIYLDIKKYEIKQIIKYIIIFAFIQVPLSIFQYFYYMNQDVVLFQDYVSGTFGERLNGDLGFLIVIITALFIAALIYGKLSIKKILLLGLFAIPIILGEIKIVLLALPIVITVIVLNKVSKNTIKILICSASVIGLIFAGLILKFPEFRNMFDVKYIKYYAYDLGYGDYTLNRISAPIYVNDTILDTTPKKIFGIGVGNGTDNGSDIVNSDFYKENSMLGAQLFFSSLYLMENGWLAMILFIIMILSVLIKAIKIQKYSNNKDEKIFALAIKGIMVMIFISFIYSLSIFNLTMGYLIFFLLGVTIRISSDIPGGNYESKIST